MKKKLLNLFMKSKINYPKGFLILTMLTIVCSSNCYSQVAIKSRGENTPNEGINKLIDGDKTTKWLDFSPTSFVVFGFLKDTAFNKYQITSGNDFPERDPKDWTIQGSTDSVIWFNLDTVTKQSWSARNQTRFFSFTNITKYKYYKWNITANGSNGIIQASEFTFLSNSDITAPAAPTMIVATNVTENSVTLSWKASLDSSSVSYYDVLKGDTLVGNTMSKSVTLMDLSASMTYKFFVKSTDSSGNTSSTYNSVTVKTAERSDTVQVKSIVISTLGDTTDFQVGDTLYLAATTSPENASNKNLRWSVMEDVGSATINANTGVLIATKAGKISVLAIATDNNKVSSLTFLLQVKADTVKIRSINIVALSDTSNFEVGDTIKFKATILPSNASNTKLKWKVDNGTGEATIDTIGRLIGLSAGKVTVVAISKDALGVTSNKFVLQIDVPRVVTDLAEGDFENLFTISPNPSNGRFSIDLPQVNESIETSVYNGKSTMVYNRTHFGTERISVDLANNATGLYFVTFRFSSKIFTKKLIVE